MTKELIPHNVTIFPCIKEVTLRYWNQHCTTWGFPFYLGEIKGSRGLPTNNHLAPSPRVIWPCLMKAKLSFYNTQPHRLFPSPHKKTAQNMPTSANIWKIFLKVAVSWLAWFVIGGALSSCLGSLPLCRPVAALADTNEKEFLKRSFICGQLVPWICCSICQSSSKHLSSIRLSCAVSLYTWFPPPLQTHIYINEFMTANPLSRIWFSTCRTRKKCNGSSGLTTLMHPCTRLLTSFRNGKLKKLLDKPVQERSCYNDRD